MSRLPQRTKPAIRKVRTAKISKTIGQIEPAFLGGMAKNVFPAQMDEMDCMDSCSMLPEPDRSICEADCL